MSFDLFLIGIIIWGASVSGGMFIAEIYIQWGENK